MEHFGPFLIKKSKCDESILIRIWQGYILLSISDIDIRIIRTRIIDTEYLKASISRYR